MQGARALNFYPEDLDSSPKSAILCGIIKNTSLHLGPDMQLQKGSPQNKQETQRIQSRRASNTVSNRGDKTQSLPIFDEEMGIINTLLSSYFYSIPARVTINEQSWGCKREWWGLCPSKAGSSHQVQTITTKQEGRPSQPSQLSSWKSGQSCETCQILFVSI